MNIKNCKERETHTERHREGKLETKKKKGDSDEREIRKLQQRKQISA